MSPTRTFITSVGASALALVFFCAAIAQGAERPTPIPERILLVTVHGLRADALTPEATPHLAALAGDAVTFSHAVTASPQSLPALVTVHTGRLPVNHRVPDAYTRPLEGVPTFAEQLRDAGWRTLAYPAEVQAHARSGLERGFARYAHEAAGWSESARADSAVAALGTGGDAPRFVWLDLRVGPRRTGWQRHVGSGAHDPGGYTDAIASIDAAVARLGRVVERGDAALLLVGVHGEHVPGLPGATELPHQIPGHGLDLTEAQLRVPFVVRAARVDPRRDATWVSTTDVAPTLLDLAGVDTGAGAFDGVSLLAHLARSVPPGAPRAIYHETDTSRLTGLPRRVAVRIGGDKLLAYGGRHLAVDVETYAPSDAEAEQRLLDALAAVYPDVETSPAPRETLTAGNVPLVALDGALQRGIAGDPRGARAEVESLAVENPRNGIIQIECGLNYSFGRDERRAAFFFDDLCERRPDLVEAQTAFVDLLFLFSRHEVVVARLDTLDAGPMYEPERLWVLGAGLVANESFDRARDTFTRAAAESAPPLARWQRFGELLPEVEEARRTIELFGKGYDTHLELGRLLGELGLFRDAYQHLNQARAFRVDLAEPEYWLGHYLVRDSRPRHAIVAFDRAIERDPAHVGALTEKAYAHLTIGELDAAFEALAAATATGDASPDAHYNYACLLARRGDAEAALHQLEVAVVKGYDDRERLANDADLDPLRSLPRFPEIIDRVSAR